MKTLIALALVTIISVAAAPVAASDIDATALAETLFQEGLKRIDAGKIHEACEKFDQSNRVQSSLGTMYYLADCYEQDGRTATAWAMFVDVAQKARAQGQTAKAQKAKERSETLEKKLVHLTIVVDTPSIDGLKIVRKSPVLGEVDLLREAYGIALPIDPGAYTISVSGPGKKILELPINVGQSDVSVHVPALESDSQSLPATSTTEPAATTENRSIWHSTGKWIGYSVGGAGLLASGIFAVVAKATFDGTKSSCNTIGGTTYCPQSTIDRQKQAGVFADVATASVIVGAIGLAFGVGIDVFVPHAEVHAAVGLNSVSLTVHF